ncbi:hypothetical protein PVAP13_5NG539186 [Panicum virgatum]|uniref:Uncharacterized protein n=1 Tax=Panicum virgatum TaxID=38727 RepID=A0A8T0S2X5_PANVG|nr:hypothetical protein PVAP13_5NG539186 [Panicum virgatum]
MDGSGAWYTVGRTSSNSPAARKVAVPPQPAAPRPRACDGRSGACRGGGAAVLAVGLGPAPRKIKSDRRPVAGGVGACRPVCLRASVGGAPRPRDPSNTPAEPADADISVAPTRGAAPFAPHADPRPQGRPSTRLALM